MRALDRKLSRETRRLLGQIVTIALVLAGGITCFISLRGTYLSLEAARAAYYDRYHFAHVFARAERVPESVARKIEALPSVERVETRIAEEVMVPIEGMGRPAYGRLLSLPDQGPPGINAPHLRLVAFRDGKDEALVLESFAIAPASHPVRTSPW